MQGQDKTIVNFIDALSAFQAKLGLWEKKMTMGQMGMFPTLNEFIEDAEDMRLDDDVKSQIINNLLSLRSEFAKYFPDTTRDDLVFVRNPYLVSDTDVVNMFSGNDATQEEFITRNKLIVEPDLRCALSTTEPRIDKLVTKMQHQPSH